MLRYQKITHIEKLRNLLRFPEERESFKFRYPKLEKADEIPGYVDLLKRPVEERMEYLTTLGVPWYPYKNRDITDKKNGERKHVSKRKSSSKQKKHSTKEYIGVVKRFDEKKGEGYITNKDDGNDIRVNIKSVMNKVPLKKGQKVTFYIVGSGLITEASNVEIMEF